MMGRKKWIFLNRGFLLLLIGCGGCGKSDATNRDSGFENDVGLTELQESAGETPTSDYADNGVDASGDLSCAPVDCDLQCRHGYKKDHNGCEVCLCRDCTTVKDCGDQMTCMNPVCASGGECRCSCENGEGMKEYSCPDGTKTLQCSCSALGVSCLEHPEYLCPTLCHPNQAALYSCPDGSQVPWCECALPKCQPECKLEGTGSEGWYDSCTGNEIKLIPCGGCKPVCKAIGSKSEGWYSSCDDVLISWSSCGPEFACMDLPEVACQSLACERGKSLSYSCAENSQVPFCSCEPPDASCPPSCLYPDTANEGWYNLCTQELIKLEKCQGCQSECNLVGSDSEGWYSSCGSRIEFAQCGTPSWNCLPEPWLKCSCPFPCTEEGESFNATGSYGVCCPGLREIDLASWDGEKCLLPNCPCKVCSLCGDGECLPPENICNCPEDCFDPVPGSLGNLCASDLDCGKGLSCLRMSQNDPAGVCSQVCNPQSESPVEQCGQGMACLPVPDHEAPGFCLQACQEPKECEFPLVCGSIDGTIPGAQAGCFFWGPCDPINNKGCYPNSQCRITDGDPICRIPGKIEEGQKCEPTNDLCAPGLFCGSWGICSPICTDDESCNPKAYDFCRRGSPCNPYGYCLIWEGK